MIVGAYCPEHLTSQRGELALPFTRYLSELVATEHELIDLDRTGGSERRQFVDAYLARESNHLGERFRQAVYRSTGGQPMRLSEYLQELKRNGELYRDDEGCWVESAAFYRRVDRSARVDTLIAARIRGLPGEIREVLAAASVEGTDFAIETVAGMLNVDSGELIQLISGEPIARGIVRPLGLYHSGPQGLSWFQFSHYQYYTFFCSQLSPLQRVHLHRALATRLEHIHRDRKDQIANELAWHFQEATEVEKTVYYLERAGRCANRLGAAEEASQLIQLAVDLVKSLPDSPENKMRESELLLLLEALPSVFHACA